MSDAEQQKPYVIRVEVGKKHASQKITWKSGTVSSTHCSSPSRGPSGVMAKGMAARRRVAASGAAASIPFAVRSTCAQLVHATNCFRSAGSTDGKVACKSADVRLTPARLDSF